MRVVAGKISMEQLAQFCYSGVVFRKQKQALFSKTLICRNDSRTFFVCLFFRLCVCLFRFEQSTDKLKIWAFDCGNEINNFAKVRCQSYNIFRSGECREIDSLAKFTVKLFLVPSGIKLIYRVLIEEQNRFWRLIKLWENVDLAVSFLWETINKNMIVKICTLQLTQIALKLKPKYETRIFQDLWKLIGGVFKK